MTEKILAQKGNDAGQITKDEAVKLVQAGRPIIDMAGLAKPQDFSDIAETERTHLRIARPKADTFFRVHREIFFDLSVYERDVEMDKETYLVAKSALPYLADESGLKQKRFYLCVTKAGTPGLWGVALPDESGRDNSWSLSGRKIAVAAREDWVRIKPDKADKSYIKVTAKIDMGEPVWPEWELQEILDMAFGDKYIDSPDHEIILALDGRA